MDQLDPLDQVEQEDSEASTPFYVYDAELRDNPHLSIAQLEYLSVNSRFKAA